MTKSPEQQFESGEIGIAQFAFLKKDAALINKVSENQNLKLQKTISDIEHTTEVLIDSMTLLLEDAAKVTAFPCQVFAEDLKRKLTDLIDAEAASWLNTLNTLKK